MTDTPVMEPVYPRAWFRVSRYGGGITEKVFDSETAKFLTYSTSRGDSRREAKSNSYGTWFPTREEAQAALDAIKARKAEREAEQRIRDAAPALLEEADAFLEGQRPFEDIEACCSVPAETYVEDEELYRFRLRLRKALSLARSDDALAKGEGA